MTELNRSIRRLGFFALALLLASASATAGDKMAMPIGFLQIEGDTRYERHRYYAGIQGHQRGRPLAGAKLALRESRIIGRAIKVEFSLEEVEAATAEALAAEVARLKSEAGMRFFLVDTGPGALRDLARLTRDLDVRLLNVSASENALRAEDCSRHVMHVMPSHAMLTDALAQYLAVQNWREVMLLQGPLEEDKALIEAFETSAQRFGLKIVDKRDFILSNDPRQREKHNIRLLTLGADYDVLFLADHDGEFGRYVPYSTGQPRPVVGSEGLVATAWHWSWERHGAPQLNQRFEKRAERRMSGSDWAAWTAVKSIVESVVRSETTDFAKVSGYLESEALTLDGYKGNPVNFRAWDNQLRQPILLHTHNAIIARAPLEGFLHPTQNMDTLGFDKGDKKCEL